MAWYDDMIDHKATEEKEERTSNIELLAVGASIVDLDYTEGTLYADETGCLWAVELGDLVSRSGSDIFETYCLSDIAKKKFYIQPGITW